MKKILFTFLLAFCTAVTYGQGFSINNSGASADGSAMLDVSSINKGFLVPRMTQAQRIAIATPAYGLLVFQTDGFAGFYYNYAAGIPLWRRLAPADETYWTMNFPHIYNNNGGNVGIGITNPEVPLSFAQVLGKKISLYRGGTGDAGFGVWGNELRIHSDYNGADITFGYDNLGSGFTERVRMKANGNVGIGTANPNAALQLGNTASNRRIVLWETNNNDHEFYGFGINGFALRYQTNNPASDHIFYSAIDASSSRELMRIKGNGNVGINNNNPLSFLDITSTGTGLNGSAMSPTFRTNSGNLGTAVGNEINIGSLGFMAGGNNTALGIRAYRTTAGNDWTGTAVLLEYDVDNTTRAAGAGSGFIALNAQGNVGIRTASPNGHLQFNNAILNRKIVLYESANNDHQYYGFGINGSTLRYQTDATGADHVFYAASSASTSNELVRITGTGNMGVGGITPGFRLDVNGRMRIRDGGGGNTAGLWLNNAANTTTPAFVGMVNDNTTGFYGSVAGWGLSMNTNTGNVGIGNTNPVRPLTFAATLGRKISLYPGGTGDVGFGVAGNRLQIYSDNSNADVAVGWDNGGTFNERFAFKPNGALAVVGNTGNSGQVLTSNGAGAAASWSTMSDLMQTWYTYNGCDVPGCYTGTYGTTFAEIPQITTVVNVTRRSRLMINAVVNMYRFQLASVLGVYGEIQLQIDGNPLGGTTIQLQSINEGYATGTYSNYFVDVNPGSYTFRVVGRGTRCEPSCGGLLPTFNAKYMTIVALPIN
jgi:hypothetical protein